MKVFEEYEQRWNDENYVSNYLLTFLANMKWVCVTHSRHKELILDLIHEDNCKHLSVSTKLHFVLRTGDTSHSCQVKNHVPI